MVNVRMVTVCHEFAVFKDTSERQKVCLDILISDVGRPKCLVLTFFEAPPTETHLDHVIYHTVCAHCLGLCHDLPVQDVAPHFPLA